MSKIVRWLKRKAHNNNQKPKVDNGVESMSEPKITQEACDLNCQVCKLHCCVNCSHAENLTFDKSTVSFWCRYDSMRCTFNPDSAKPMVAGIRHTIGKSIPDWACTDWVLKIRS